MEWKLKSGENSFRGDVFVYYVAKLQKYGGVIFLIFDDFRRLKNSNWHLSFQDC